MLDPFGVPSEATDLDGRVASDREGREEKRAGGPGRDEPAGHTKPASFARMTKLLLAGLPNRV